MNCPIEILNQLDQSGLPVHKLRLKVGAIVILFRNINPRRGLVNGTRMIITRLDFMTNKEFLVFATTVSY